MLVRGNKATLYFLDPDKMRRVTHTAENGALFICQSGDQNEVYLLQMQIRPSNVMSSEELAMLPAT